MAWKNESQLSEGQSSREEQIVVEDGDKNLGRMEGLKQQRWKEVPWQKDR